MGVQDLIHIPACLRVYNELHGLPFERLEEEYGLSAEIKGYDDGNSDRLDYTKEGLV